MDSTMNSGKLLRYCDTEEWPIKLRRYIIFLCLLLTETNYRKKRSKNKVLRPPRPDHKKMYVDNHNKENVEGEQKKRIFFLMWCFHYLRFITLFAQGNIGVDLRTLRAIRVLRPLKLVSGIPSTHILFSLKVVVDHSTNKLFFVLFLLFSKKVA